jgi:hypothetical protein
MPFGGVSSNDIIQITKQDYDKMDDLYKIDFVPKGPVYDMYGIYGFVGNMEFLGEKAVKFEYEGKHFKIRRNVVAFRKIIEDKIYFYYEIEKYTSNLYVGRQK